MGMYVKKPLPVEAHQWFKNGDHPQDYLEPCVGFKKDELVTFSAGYQESLGWEGKIVRYYRDPDVNPYKICKKCGDIMHNHGWIDTLEGGHIVCPSDWIVTGVDGEHRPVKHDIFIRTYEKVSFEA